ncbi:MAG TPA: hypothetical protein PKN21_09035 [Bacteroidales bacterium]|jgi:hypothetical protein|nr:hypothetical protein [Bacteroidales bacterium]
MGTQALIFMITAEAIITGLTLYFFIRVLVTKKKDEPDSYSDN